jgi:hypothetical protein
MLIDKFDALMRKGLTKAIPSFESLQNYSIALMSDGESRTVHKDMTSTNQNSATETILPLRCIAKTLIAFAIVEKTRQNGDDINANLAITALTELQDAVSMRDLLTHTAGFSAKIRPVSPPDARFFPNHSDYVKTANQHRIAASGQFFSYSDVGFALAIIAAYRMYNMSILDLIKEALDKYGINGCGVTTTVDFTKKDNKNAGIYNDLAMPLSDLMDFVKLHAEWYQSERLESTDQTIGFMLNNGHAHDLRGGVAIPGYAWLGLANGLYCHAGTSRTHSSYIFFHPEKKLYGFIYTEPANGSFIHLLAALDILSINKAVMSSALGNANGGDFGNRCYKNGEYRLSVKNADNILIAEAFQRRVIDSSGVEKSLGSFECRPVRSALYTADIVPGLIPRGNAKSAVELINIDEKSALRINDVLYLSV